MTFTNEEFIPEEELEFEEEIYPTLFGITLNPRNSGILCGAIGILGSLYLLVSFIMPANESYQELKADRQTKEEQLERINPDQLSRELSGLDTQLQQSKTLRAQVISLFSQTKSVDTLLLDINSFVKARGATLISFKPVNATPQLIKNNSFGKAANKKLSKQTFTVEIEGTYQQIQSIIRDIERLQFLIVVNKFTAEPTDDKTVFKLKRTGGKIQGVPTGTRKLKSKFDIDILFPASNK